MATHLESKSVRQRAQVPNCHGTRVYIPESTSCFDICLILPRGKGTLKLPGYSLEAPEKQSTLNALAAELEMEVFQKSGAPHMTRVIGCLINGPQNRTPIYRNSQVSIGLQRDALLTAKGLQPQRPHASTRRSKLRQTKKAIPGERNVA